MGNIDKIMQMIWLLRCATLHNNKANLAIGLWGWNLEVRKRGLASEGILTSCPIQTIQQAPCNYLYVIGGSNLFMESSTATQN
jgi:hypothetical protein